MENIQIKEYFDELKTKDIICWGCGKHFRNVTYAFLCKSGLIKNLRGFTGAAYKDIAGFTEQSYEMFGKDELVKMESSKTVILLAVTGWLVPSARELS